jgi:PIN domain nuclease of toxin-antitoxin system
VTDFLIDTNALLFLGLRSDRLSETSLARLREGRRFVSQVCGIELAIKQTIGKLALPSPFETSFAMAFAEIVRQIGATTLMLDMGHVERLSQLPLHHRDPFDRLIISQAINEGLTIVTRDRAFEAYMGLDILRI